MGQALYRKYRSKSLTEIVGQEHITTTLARAIKANKISHAYLFTGPKGVGKTSIARILAHEVNGLPYTDESTHLDIIEIDAASNRRIDEIRDLRDKVHIAPTSAKYKVYIIDEVHMLTKEAFNALLKTLEEPPAHVIFILATTESHKLPDTIISRTQRFTFKSIDPKKAVEHLRSIAKQENIDIDTEALELLALHGGGSFRDAIGLLDQVGGNTKVTKHDVEQLLGVAPEEAILALYKAVTTQTPADVAHALDGFISKGIAASQIAKQLSALLRKHLLEQTNVVSSQQLTEMLASLLQVPVSNDPASALEVILFNANLTMQPVAPQKPVAPEPAPKQPAQTSSTSIPKAPEKVTKKEQAPEIVPESTAPPEPVLKMVENSEDISSWWPELVTSIKKHNNTLYGVVRMAHPVLKGDELTLSFAFGLHTKKITDPQTMAIMHAAVNQLTGRNIIIKAVQNKALKGIEPSLKINTTVIEPVETLVNQTETSVDTPELTAITSIFGGGEVLDT